MCPSSLHDRLQRLKPPALPAVELPRPSAPLESLERELLGATPTPGHEPSLKERLERLVKAAARKEEERRREPAAVPLEELVAGMRVESPRGEFFRVDSSVHLEVSHGDLALSRVHTVSPETVEVLTAEPALAAFDLRRAAFLDTETTGLAGGAGTSAFLIGLGFFDGDRFRVRQYFMRDYHEEAALLHGLAEELQRFEQIVTFNGKMFDLPLLEARFRLNRCPYPLARVPHLDLLHPARRLWKTRIESCRLQSLETTLLGLRRSGDIPGEEIPRVYFDWVRRRDARLLARVFEHNRQDIVSLAVLSVLACLWLEEDRAEDPRDLYSLGRVLERAGLFDRSEREYERALERAAGALRGKTLLRLAWRAKRTGKSERALRLWTAAGEAGEMEGWRQLAIHHEHRSRDWTQALAAVERGSALARSGPDAASRDARFADGFDRRRRRLLRKQRASLAGSRPSSPAPEP